MLCYLCHLKSVFHVKSLIRIESYFSIEFCDTYDVCISSRVLVKELSSNSELKSEYLTWDKFQVMTINTDLVFS